MDPHLNDSRSSRLECHFVPVLVRFLDWVSSHKFRRPGITKSHRSTAGIPSVRKPPSKVITSDSVELCETEVCFLHIHLFLTRVHVHDARSRTDHVTTRNRELSVSHERAHSECRTDASARGLKLTSQSPPSACGSTSEPPKQEVCQDRSGWGEPFRRPARQQEEGDHDARPTRAGG